MNNTNKTPAEIRSEYVSKSKEAKYNNMLASCTPLEQQIIKTLELLDKQSGGQINRLFAVYQAIKMNSK